MKKSFLIGIQFMNDKKRCAGSLRMKLLLIIVFSTTTRLSAAQDISGYNGQAIAQEWVDYYHDSTLIVSMPYYHYEREENGLLMSSAKVGGGLIYVTHQRNDDTRNYNVRDTSDLKRIYSIVRKEIMDSQKGKVLKSEMIEQDSLKWEYFVVHGSLRDVKQEIHNLTIFVNDGLYLMTFFELGLPTPEKDEARKKIFASARINPKIRKSQVSSNAHDPFFIFKALVSPPMLISTGVALIVLLFILGYKARKAQSIEKISRP